MFQIFFVFISVLFQVIPNVFGKITFITTETCIIDTDIWTVYSAHFILVNSLTITVLHSADHQNELNEFAESVIQNINTYNHYHTIFTIKIQEKFVDNIITTKQHDRCFRSAVVLERRRINEEDLIKVKKRTTDSAEGYLIIAWNVEMLLNFLDENYQLMLPKARATYAIIFATEQLENDLDSILRHFWNDYNIVNIIAQTPCTCDGGKIFVHHALVKNDSYWGIIRNYTIPEVLNNSKLIINPLNDFDRFPLKVSFFERYPTLIRDLPKFVTTNPVYSNLNFSKGFGGLDGFVSGTLAKHLNFDLVVDENLDNEPFGRVLPNGTITGSLGDVVNRKVLFSGNGRFLMDYGTTEIEFTVPFDADRFCLVTPKAPEVPRWKTLFNCFKIWSWFFIFVVYVVCVIFWYFLGQTENITRVVYEIFSFLVGIPSKIVPSISQLLFLTSCLMFNITIVGIIQGSFFTSFTTTIFYQDINTIEDLVQSEIPVASNFWFLIQDESDLIKRLKEKTVKINGKILDSIAYHRNVAGFNRKQNLELLVKTEYMGTDGIPLVHIVNECITSYFIVSIVPKGSPFLIVFNRVITKLFEGGLTSKWYNDVAHGLISEKRLKSDKDNEFDSFSLYDIQVAFYVVILGHICSILVFFCEIIFKRYFSN
ncbi:hypothetical protein BDFB_012556 [Asbolus verrucosus]|uniref:Lig chan domain containing protein n=1 Tax=Asbolus verrucosus TaxID=1661398 RepID=A0A482VS62_ASBVE|nr:hypothetical protein BDFB_012556 [Asbolus verrucosus]